MTTPTTLIVDFGGVLTSDLWASARAFAERAGLGGANMGDLLLRHPVLGPMFADLEAGRIPQTTFEQHVAAITGLSPDNLLARICADLRPEPVMLAAVGTLRRAGVRIAILSNSCGAGDYDPYAGFELDQLAEVVVISDVVGMRKPEPEIFQLTLDKLGVPAAECVFVDDTASHLTTADAIGMRTIHHTGIETTLTRLEELFGIPLQ